MRVVVTASNGLLTIASRGKLYDYYGVPAHIQKRAKAISRNGGQCWNMLKPYAQDDVREIAELKLKREGKQERGIK